MNNYRISRTVLRQPSILSSMCFGSMDTCSVKSSLSTVVICEKFTVDVLSKPDTAFSNNKLPGKEANSVLDVIAAQIMVLMLLRLNSLLWIISTGRRFPSTEPSGTGRFAHHISPRTIYQSTSASKRYEAAFKSSSRRELWFL